MIGLKLLNPEEFKKIEPNVEGVKALWVPESGIIDYKEVANKLAEKIIAINFNIFNLFMFKNKFSTNESTRILNMIYNLAYT